MTKIFLSLVASLFAAPTVLAVAADPVVTEQLLQDNFGPGMMARFGGFGPGWMMSGYGLSGGWFILWHFVFGLIFIALATWVVKAVWQNGKKK